MSTIQEMAIKRNMSYDEFVGEMRKRGCSEATAAKIWNGSYNNFCCCCRCCCLAGAEALVVC